MPNSVQLDELPEDKRGRRRSRVLLAATLRTETTSIKANLLNLSAGGAQLDAGSPPPEGAEVTLCRGKLEICGRVMWVKEHRFGISFHSQIDESLVLEHIKSISPRSKVVPFR